MKKLLFVEDDPMIVRIYRGKFQAEGYEVEIAGDGEAALQTLKKGAPDLVLLDLQLPKVNGVEVLKYIRAQPHMKQLPVVVFSNAFLGKLVEEAWQAGATTCLTKAKCTPDQLLETLRSALANKLPVATPPPSRVTPPKLPAAAGSDSSAAIIPATAALTDLAREASAWSSSSAAQSRPSFSAVAAATLAPVRKLPPAPSTGGVDAQSQSLIRELFLSACPHILTTLRTHLLPLADDHDAPRRSKAIQEMLRSLHSLTGNAGLAGFERIAQTASALEALLKEVHEKAQAVSASLVRTVSSAVDALEHLVAGATHADPDEAMTPLALVVEEDLICGRAVCSALAHANIRSVSFNNLQVGLSAVEQNAFDIILIGLNLPKAEGLSFLTKLRAVSATVGTPVVLLTSPEHFDDYAVGLANSECDVIAKPFLLIEVTVKALTHVTTRGSCLLLEQSA